jgi:predicted DNA-binding protein YlxM (UPF0122 family)
VLVPVARKLNSIFKSPVIDGTGTTVIMGGFFCEEKMPKFIDLTGQRFGRLIVLERAKNRAGRVAWLCHCDCGNKKITTTKCLRNGTTRSCGCFQLDRIKETNTLHNRKPERLYQSWQDMKKRCLNKNSKHYKNYGGRGIIICDEWMHNFIAFRDWALSNGYADNLTLDRIDNNRGYEPNNCKWSTKREQNRNKRNNVIYNGKSLRYAAEEHNISWKALYSRVKRGMPVKDALTKPVKKFIKHGYKQEELKEIAKQCDISITALYSRLYRGMIMEEAKAIPRLRKRHMTEV